MRCYHTTASNHMLASQHRIAVQLVERQHVEIHELVALRGGEHDTFENSSTSTGETEKVLQMSELFAFEFFIEFNVHRLDSFLVEVLARHCTRQFRDFGVPVSRCRCKRPQ